MNAIDERACGKPGCDNFGKPGLNIVGHGWFVTKSGRRRRYRCTVCGERSALNTGTAYRGLRCSRREFDQVASLRVEGVSISATARVTGHSRTTIARWLERASTAAACFHHRLLRDFDVIELQADERCTFIGSKRRTLWLFATIEVCSRVGKGNRKTRRSVNAVSIAQSENCFGAPGRPDGDGRHASVASAESHSVTSPRWTKACSYADQFPTRYFVLYFGWTFDLMSRSCTRSGHRGQRAYSCLVAAEGLCTNAGRFGALVDNPSQHR